MEDFNMDQDDDMKSINSTLKILLTYENNHDIIV